MAEPANTSGADGITGADIAANDNGRDQAAAIFPI